MKLIFGLGNPGKEYEKNRHNVGFRVIDELLNHFGIFHFKKDKKMEIWEVDSPSEKILFVKPLTFMNQSGEAVASLASFYKIPHANIWIVYDDIDLPLGKIRIRKNGNPGTHNGMKSVTERLGTKNFPRFRVGIESRGGEHEKQQKDIAAFVLENFKKSEFPLVEKAIEHMAKTILYALEYGLEKAMNKYNSLAFL